MVSFSINVQTLVIALCSCVLGVTAAIVTVVMASGFSYLHFCLPYVRNISKKQRHVLVYNPCCFTFSTHHSHLLWLNHCGLVVSQAFNHRFGYLPVHSHFLFLLLWPGCCISHNAVSPFSFCQELKYSFVKDTGKRCQNFGGGRLV